MHKATLWGLLLLISYLPVPVYSQDLKQDQTEQIIKAVIQAYGGNKLINADGFKLTDYNTSPWPGQGETPDYPDFFRHHSELIVDLKNQRKSLLSWRVSRSAIDLDRFTFDGKLGRTYDILNNKYSDSPWLNYASVGRTELRASDTFIVYRLGQGDLPVNYLGTTRYRGEQHSVLRINLSGVEYDLFVSPTSNRINKMVRLHPSAGQLTYAFENHQLKEGILYAAQMYFYVADSPRRISLFRDIELNPPMPESLFTPKGFKPWGELQDMSQLTVTQLAADVYHVGQQGAYSLFVDAGDYYVATGSGAGLAERFAALKDHTGQNKALKKVILSHHHRNLLASAREAVELGASIVTVKQNLKTFERYLGAEFDNAKFEFVDQQASFADGKLEIYDIATLHAEHYLLAYVPSAQLIFGEDHFDTELKSAPPRVHQDMVKFSQVIQQLDLDIRTLSSARSLRLLSMQELLKLTDEFTPPRCPAGYSICQRG